MAGFFDDTEDTTSPVVKSFFDETEDINTPAAAPNDSDFIPGVQRGLQNLQATLYGAGALAGSGLKNLGAESVGQSLQDFGMEGYKRNIEEAKQYPKKNSFKDVYTGEAGIGGTIDYVQGTLGELVPSMVEAAAGAVIGSAVAPGVGTVAGGLTARTVIKKGIEKSVEQAMKRGIGNLTEAQVRKQLTGQALKKLGGKVGIAGAVMPMESGGMYAELLQEKGIDAPETALLFGALATSLEFAGGNSKLVDTFVDALSKGAIGNVKKTAKELLTNIPQEALQEGGQELLSVLNTVANTDEKLLTAENVERIIESMAAGAVGGGAGAAVNAGFSSQATKPGALKTDQELALDKRSANILAGDKDQIDKSVQKLSTDLKSNQELLNDLDRIEEEAKKANVEPTELIRKIIDDNKNNQGLLDKINSGIKAKEDLTKKEYDNLSPEDKAVKDIENKLIAQREADKQKLAVNLDAINKREAIALDQYKQETDPEKKKLIADRVFNLRKEKNTLTDKSLQIQEVNRVSEFADAKKADEIRQEKETFYNKLWLSGVNKDASESGQAFEANASQLDQMVKDKDQEKLNKVLENIVIEPDPQARQTLYENLFMQPGVKDAAESAEVFAAQGEQDITSQRKQELQKTMDMITKESDPAVRQKLYNQMFLQPGVKNAQESAEVFLTQKFTEREKSIIEDYWQGVKQELNLANEKMTPGTEAFMRKKFFETQLDAIERNVKQEAKAKVESNRNVTIPLAEQNKRQVMFQQIAKDLGDFPSTNRQATQTEIPRNLPVGLSSTFTNEQQVYEAPQSEEDENQKEFKQAFYSRLQSAIFNDFPAELKAQKVISYLKSKLKDTNEQRPYQEIQAIGLDSWLATKKPSDIVTKEELSNFVKANMIEVEDVVLGNGIDGNPSAAEVKINQALRDDGYTAEYDPQTEDFYYTDRDGEEVDFSDLPQDVQQVISDIGNGSAAHFAKYTEPGADEGSYREMFVTVTKNKDNRQTFEELKAAQQKLINDNENNGVAVWMLPADHPTRIELKRLSELAEDRWHNDRAGIKGEWQDGHSQYSEIENPIVRIRFNTINTDGHTILRIEEMQGPSDANQQKMPAYLRDNIYQLGVKRVIAYAKEQGFDGITFATKNGRSAGETQADRYSLEKQVDSINVLRKDNDNFVVAIVKDGAEDSYKDVSANQLGEYVGKDLATKIINDLPNSNNAKSYSGLDLKVGGEGLKQLYDNQLPKMFEAYSKEKMVDGVLPITKQTPSNFPMFELEEGKTSNGSSRETSLGNVLSQLKSVEGPTGQLANFISDFIPESKLNIKVIIDPSVRSARYVGGKVNTITLRDPSQLFSTIHEVTHAVTAREMIANPGIRAQVKLLMERVKNKAIKEGILTPAQAELLNTERTSRGYKENLKGNFKYNSVAYGLLNEFEFLAQAMGNQEFQALLKATSIADKGVLRNAWDAFVEVVMKALGIKDTNKNAFGETLSIIAKLASQENVDQFAHSSNESLVDATSRIQNLPAFQKWFGDSKVVDGNDNPLVVYHGTNADIKKFERSPEQLFHGHYFTHKPGYAEEYAKHHANQDGGNPALYPVYLSIQNPLIIEKGVNFNPRGIKGAIAKLLFAKKFNELNAVKEYLNAPESSMTLTLKGIEKLKALGYDGVVNNVWDEMIVFDSTQIKSIFNNKWNESNPDISENYEALEVEQRLPQAEYDAIYKEKSDLLQSIMQQARMKYHEVKLLADKAFGSISTRLKNVDPELSEHLRWLDFKTSQKIIDVLKAAKPLLEATKRMSPEDKSAWNWARLNSDEGKIEQIAQKYNLTNDLINLREKFNQIRQEAISIGYDVGFIDEYWPRVIKDQEGFLQATQEISQRADFTEAIRAQAKKLGITQEQFERDFPEVKADIISNLILGRASGIGGPGNIKARVFETIPKKYAKFYMDADAALMQYVYSMTKKIEARKFFGKVPARISDLKSLSKRKDTELIKLKQLADMARVENPEALVDYEKRIISLNEDLTRIEQEINKFKQQRDYTENIGAYIDEMQLTGRIKPADEKTVKDILTARFNEQGTHGIVNSLKNAAYIDVMGNFASAITQIGDLAWAMYVGKVWTPSGFLGTAKNIVKATSGSFKITKRLYGGSLVTKEDIGIERIAQEFADGTTLGKAVSKVFKIVQLERVDSIGKEVLINNALDQYKAEAKRDPEALARKIRPTFGNKSLDVVQEILADVPSDNVKMLLYSKLLDFQSVALSEMPEFYLKAGNGRVVYMLKTYTLKQFDVFRKEVIHNLKSDNPQQRIQGITNMIQLMALLTIANAGADELKDFMLGKETRFSDNVIENFLVMGGASRYTQLQVSKEGFGSAIMQQILPPMKFINSASKDLHESYKNYVSGDVSSFDHARIIDSIPVLGKLYYWHYGRGEENKKSLAENDFSKATKDADLFKKQLENSTDKRVFIESNLDRFKQMKLQENFQSALNRNKAVINKLEKIPSTENVQTRLGQLKAQREQILQKYLEVAETLQ